jgi:hypothetical protein
MRRWSRHRLKRSEIESRISLPVLTIYAAASRVIAHLAMLGDSDSKLAFQSRCHLFTADSVFSTRFGSSASSLRAKTASLSAILFRCRFMSWMPRSMPKGFDTALSFNDEYRASTSRANAVSHAPAFTKETSSMVARETKSTYYRPFNCDIESRKPYCLRVPANTCTRLLHNFNFPSQNCAFVRFATD